MSFRSSYKLSHSQSYRQKEMGVFKDMLCRLRSSLVAPIVLEQLVLAGLANGGACAQGGAQRG